MKLIFGAPVALLAPYVGYMLIWIVSWIYEGVPGIAVQYWPSGMFCYRDSAMQPFCGRSPDELAWFVMIGFFTCCLVGWEAVRILMPGVNDPTQIVGRKTALSKVTKGIAWGIVLLPTLIIAPHIFSTLASVPGAWSSYGWGTETMIDFIRMWVVGTMAMFLYGVLRYASLSN
ncbi:MAG: hypothetical protein IMF08_11310 [Proteobacteria bacterium]|nr:hypothetical protein [Pseudomonadota bacterium]